ncbi:MAG: prolipoprotein diacylglyceryl transferase [Firmicutes bacterium]|nr:prolipoprotein diacylglyceryl transferase [Bacillota bacterium]
MGSTHYISFPGLGIGPFEINTVAFSLFGRNVAWYGVIICVGIILAFLYGEWRAKKNEGISSDDYLDLSIFLIPISVICARLYYVIFNWSEGGYDSFLDVIAIWRGGLAIYGAILGGFATILVFSKIKKIKTLKLLDAIAPGVMIGQIIGRWGNFVNAEAHGGKTDLPWRMGISSAADGEAVCVHPTFMYESLWNLIGFIIVNFVYKKKKFDGQIFYLYIAWYGFGRGFIEMLRTDSLWLGNIRVSSALGFICFFVGTALYIVSAKKARARAAEGAEYENQFGAQGGDGAEITSNDGETAAQTTSGSESISDADNESMDSASVVAEQQNNDEK